MMRTETATAKPSVELIDSSPLLGRPAELLERADRDGYLFFRGLLDRDRVLRPRSIARVMVPSSASEPTPAHQHHIHIQGTKNVWTAWLPLGDCPADRRRQQNKIC